MRRTPLITLAAAAAVSLLGTTLAPAHASEPDEVLGGLPGGVLSLAVAGDGTVYASQNFMGIINQVMPGGEPTQVYADEGGREIGGLSVDGDVLTFTATSQGGPANARVYTLTPDGAGGLDQEEIADTWAFEKADNPDGRTTYGIPGLSKSCKKDIPKEVRPFVTAYKGIKESHPYATTTAGGVTYVADAAGNAILAVEGGEVSTFAVLPPVKVKVTKQFRKGMGLPKCTQGKTYKGEPVPTDVELHDGDLYVTTIGGGLGEQMPLGTIYRISAAGKVSKVTGGLSMPVGLAISDAGDFWVSSLAEHAEDGGVLKNPDAFSVEEFFPIAASGDVDIHDGDFYVARTGLFDPEEGPSTGAVLRHPLVEANAG